MGRGSRRGKPVSLFGQRCSYPKCRKLSKDLIDGKFLCRKHSPARLGFTGGAKMEVESVEEMKGGFK